MGKAANHKLDRNQKAAARTAQEIGESEMAHTHVEHLPTNASFLTVDCEADDEWLDVEVSDHDLALVEWLLLAVARNDVALVTKIVASLPRSNLSLEALSFRDTDSDQVYSMLGLAKSQGAGGVAAYLMSCGLHNDFIDDGRIFHCVFRRT